MERSQRLQKGDGAPPSRRQPQNYSCFSDPCTGTQSNRYSCDIHSLIRNGKAIPAQSLGIDRPRWTRLHRCGGLILHPMFDRQASRRDQWQKLMSDTGTLSMESGLLRLVDTLLERLHKSLGRPSFEQLLEYILNKPVAWDFLRSMARGIGP